MCESTFPEHQRSHSRQSVTAYHLTLLLQVPPQPALLLLIRKKTHTSSCGCGFLEESLCRTQGTEWSWLASAATLILHPTPHQMRTGGLLEPNQATELSYISHFIRLFILKGGPLSSITCHCKA